MFTTLFPGGTGKLVLTDPDDLLDTGIEVEAKPSGKNVKKLSLLSGGERSLTALAFLFAVFRSRPSPFYVMDEVEAALDDVNLHRFLGLIAEFRQEAQLLIVSHQKRTMEAGDSLLGVTMQPGGSSKVITERVERRPGRADRFSSFPSRTAAIAAQPPACSVTSVAFGGDGVDLPRPDRARAAVRHRRADRQPAPGPAFDRGTAGASPIAPPTAPPRPGAPDGRARAGGRRARGRRRRRPTLRGRMSRARAALAGAFAGVRGRRGITDETWDDLEEALLRADVGIGVTTDLLDGLRTRVKDKEITEPDELLDALRDRDEGASRRRRP